MENPTIPIPNDRINRSETELPESLVQAAKKRVEEAQEEIKRVLEAFQNDPTSVELNQQIYFNRVKRIKESPIAPLPIGGKEAILGKTEDFIPVAYLEVARLATKAVGRVILNTNNLKATPHGSGFMITPLLFMTNNHVISSKENTQRFLLEFDHERDVSGAIKETTRFKFDPDTFFYTRKEDDLDFTIVAVGNKVAGPSNLSNYAYCPMFEARDHYILSEFVNIIQHPEGSLKQVVFRENQLVNRGVNVIHYLADTMHGSSGSPVFNDQWEVVGLHHWGDLMIDTAENGNKTSKDVNEGIQTNAILTTLKSALNAGEFTPTQQEFVKEILNPKSRGPIAIAQIGKTVEKERIDNDKTIDDPELVETPKDSPEEQYTDLVTIPLEISIRLGKISGIATNTLPKGSIQSQNETGSGDPEAIKIDRNYNNRNGYNKNFLPGYSVELPIFTDQQRNDLAPKLNRNTSEDPNELKYQHFSVFMNKKRRTAFFTAVNIDGNTWIAINRDTGKPQGKKEASEKWYIDPRISEDYQLEQYYFDNQKPSRIFDRGHLVRRQDPTWGTSSRAIKANADTFHFTNCAHQQSNFNQSTKIWQGIENYILDNVRAEREKVTVFTGPIFRENDPVFKRDIQIPMSFWKILVRVENGKLKASAFLANHSEKIREILKGHDESFEDLGVVEEFQTSVIEIERLTGFDFGILQFKDTFRSNNEGLSMVPVTGFSDIMI